MNYVKYKLSTPYWWDFKDRYMERFSKDGLYIFPIIVDDNTDNFLYLDENNCNWEREFEFVSEEYFIQNTLIPKDVLNFVDSLLSEIKNPLSDGCDSNCIMASKILKQYNYGCKSLKI